jgi:hypothetical protein
MNLNRYEQKLIETLAELSERGKGLGDDRIEEIYFGLMSFKNVFNEEPTRVF